MPKIIAFLLLLVPAALAMPHGVHLEPWKEVNEQSSSAVIWPNLFTVPVMMPRHHRPGHIGDGNENPVQEVVHVHHVPVKIPLYAGIVVHDQYQRRSIYSDTCDAPQGHGLKNLLRQAKDLLPLAKIKEIVTASVTNDQQVQALVTLLKSDAYRVKVKELSQTREYRIVVDYMCKVLNLNVNDMGRFINLLFGFGTVQYDPTAEFKGRPGSLGLLQDIRAALPRQELKDLYQKLMTTDEYLSAAVQQIRSNDYRQLLRNFRSTPQYLEARDQLLNVGVPLQDLQDLIKTALGLGGGDELDNSSEELKI